MRTTLSIDDVLLARAKRRATEQGVTLGSFVEQALREHFSAPRVRGTVPAVPTYDGGEMKAGIDPSSNRDLWDALDEAEPPT